MSVPDRTYNRGLSVCYPPDVKNAKFFDAGVVTMMLGPEEVLMYGRHSVLRDTRLINMKVVGNFKCMNHRGGYLCAAIGLLWPIKTRKAWFKLRMLRWGGWLRRHCLYIPSPRHFGRLHQQFVNVSHEQVSYNNTSGSVTRSMSKGASHVRNLGNAVEEIPIK